MNSGTEGIFRIEVSVWGGFQNIIWELNVIFIIYLRNYSGGGYASNRDSKMQFSRILH